MIDLTKRLQNIEASLNMLAYDQSQLVTDDELVDARIEIFSRVEQLQIDISAAEKQTALLEDIINNAKQQQGR